MKKKSSEKVQQYNQASPNQIDPKILEELISRTEITPAGRDAVRSILLDGMTIAQASRNMRLMSTQAAHNPLMRVIREARKYGLEKVTLAAFVPASRTEELKDVFFETVKEMF